MMSTREPRRPTLAGADDTSAPRSTWGPSDWVRRGPDDVAQVLTDPALDAQLRRDGFVRFPLVSAAEAADLRSAYGYLHGWSGSGFLPDLTIDDPLYRRRVRAVLGASLDDLVSARFVSHVPFLRNYLCKWMGEDSDLYLHQDWMYVDERTSSGGTYVTWIALQDIDGHNGQLQVLPGSHLLDRSLRGTELTGPWVELDDVIRPRLVTVPVKAGDCVVFDNALVHCSYPNFTPEPRVVATVVMRPSDSPMAYFRRVDDATAARYDVDQDFLCWATPQQLTAAPPDLPVAELIEVAPLDITPAALAEFLDARRPVPTVGSRLVAAVERVRERLR